MTLSEQQYRAMACKLVDQGHTRASMEDAIVESFKRWHQNEMEEVEIANIKQRRHDRINESRQRDKEIEKNQTNFLDTIQEEGATDNA